ncbi:unnamed protein product [Mucor hiemalis]
MDSRLWHPNEQLLLRAAVQFKKHEGTLFVTPQRVAWQQQGSSQLTPSIYYNDILALAQTPNGSPKVLLKISAKPPISKDYTFQFTSRGDQGTNCKLLARARGLSSSSAVGTPAPITPSSVAASPSPSTPQFVNNTASPIPLQQQTTTNNTRTGSPSPGSPKTTWRNGIPGLKAFFNDDVDEEDFWSSPYVKRIRQKLKKDAVSREGKQKGKSSRMVELKPGQQEGSDIKYTLTSQIIHNIFTEFPSVKRAYDTNVPDKMTEQAFWKRFLASEFFHRSRTGGRSQLTPYDDIFDRCLQEEDDENSKPPPMSRMDKIRFDIDLSTTAEDHLDGGNAPDFTMKPGREAQSLPLIRRFNKHSSRVLETAPSKLRREVPTFEEEVEKDVIITELMDEPPPEKIILDIQDTRRYFESQTGGLDELKINEEDTRQLLSGYKRKFQNWQPQMAKQVMEPKMSDKVCVSLTATIKKKIRNEDKSANDIKLPPQVQQKVQSYHSATNEILRHFWSSFEPYKPEKNLRMIEGLNKQQEKLKEILNIVASHDGDSERCKQTLMPVLQAVDRALETSKKRGRKKRV